METNLLKQQLKEFRGTGHYIKHMHPGRSPIYLTQGCLFIRERCQAYWLFNSILSFQLDLRLKNVNFQIWELRQLQKDLSCELSVREDSDKKPIIIQAIPFSNFLLDSIKIWVIGNVALLPGQY